EPGGGGRDPDRERCRGWAYSDRDPGPGGGADGGTRPCHRCFTKATLDTVRWRAGSKRAAHSCAAPARSHVRSAARRSALPKACHVACTEVGRSFRRKECCSKWHRGNLARCPTS